MNICHRILGDQGTLIMQQLSTASQYTGTFVLIVALLQQAHRVCESHHEPSESTIKCFSGSSRPA